MIQNDGDPSAEKIETFHFVKPIREKNWKDITYTFYNTNAFTTKPHLVEEADIKRFVKLLKGKSDFFEIIEVSRSEYPDEKEYLFRRINELNDLLLEEDENLSLESLRGLLVVLYIIKKHSKPEITVNDSGFFQLNWKKDKSNMVSMEFREKLLLNYVIFMPSRYTPERIILNGFMNVLDFKDYLSRLGVHFFKEIRGMTMTKTLFLIFNHQFTPLQSEDAGRSLGVERIETMPEPVREVWGNVPPELAEIREYLAPVREWLDHNAKAGDAVLIQGDFGATCQIAETDIDLHIKPGRVKYPAKSNSDPFVNSSAGEKSSGIQPEFL